MGRSSVPSAIRHPLFATTYDLTRLKKNVKPFKLHWFATLRSTNTHAADLRRKGKLFAPAVVATGSQTSGRGRGENAWWSRPGCITATFVLPIDEQVEPYQIPLIAGLAVRNAAAELSGNPGIQLKWPNDVMYEGKKLAGLLCERTEKADLVGVGLNVTVDPSRAPYEFRDKVTSISEIRGEPLDLTDAYGVLASHLHVLLTHQAERPFGDILREYDSHHMLVGKKVTVTQVDGERVSGVCEGLDKMGRLVLKDGKKTEKVIAGHVRMG